MPTAVDLLRGLTGSPDWSPRWMTVGEIADELERFGFWERPGLRGYEGKARLDFLLALLTRPNAAWARMGPHFKPSALLTARDRELIEEWLDEDLSRILLGEAA